MREHISETFVSGIALLKTVLRCGLWRPFGRGPFGLQGCPSPSPAPRGAERQLA